MQKISEVDVTIAGRRLPLRKVQLICEDPSLAKQSFAKAADIRYILERFAKTGVLPTSGSTPIYGDFTSATSEGYQESLNLVASIKSKFERLPAELRDRFENDASKLLDFLSDEKNNEEAIKLGLREAEKPLPFAEQPKGTSTTNPPTVETKTETKK